MKLVYIIIGMRWIFFAVYGLAVVVSLMTPNDQDVEKISLVKLIIQQN